MRPRSRTRADSPPVCPPSGARVAVIRLRSLGDCVLTTPAIALLRQARPDLNLAIVVEPQFAPIFEGNPDIDEILSPDLLQIARWRPAFTLNLHGGTKSAQLTMASRAPLRAGFRHHRFQTIYNIRIPSAQKILAIERKVHTAEHLASAMFYLGVPVSEIPRARLFANTSPQSHPYAAIHPFASAPDKVWPAARFREVARYLEAQLDLEPVFIGASGESVSEFNGYRCVLGARLETVKSLLASATLFVGNDSGPAHMAAAFGLPVVVLFGASDPEIWGPWKTEAAVLTSEQGITGIQSERAITAISALVPQPAR